MLEVPLLPSLVAVIVTVPATLPVTSPPALTVATVGLLLDQDTARPVSGVPFASLGVAVSCTVPPATTLPVAGLTVTVATGTGGTVVTVIAAVPLCPSLVAVIVAAPAARAVTSPRSSTLATFALLVDQITARPVREFPLPSSGVAVSCTVCPTRAVAAGGVTTTWTTGGVVPVLSDAGFSHDCTANATAMVAAKSATKRRRSMCPNVIRPASGASRCEGLAGCFDA